MELPTEKIKPISNNPKFLILFGKPKCGKTTAVSFLENALIIDLEKGSNYVEALKVECNNFEDLKKLKKALIEKNKEVGGFAYKYGVIDTATKLEDLILPLALDLYRKTPMGSDFGLNEKTGVLEFADVRGLSHGAGYLYIREAFKMVVDGFKPLFEYIILLGHTKDRNVNKKGKELSEQSLDLSGKLERIISADADAIGYVYREENKTIINFNGGSDFVTEARPLHLRGKEITILESDENNNLTSHWDRIYI
jgi:hypothetical protein